jgi:phosphatidylinositol glycan class Q protein
MHPFSILTLGIFVAGYTTARWDLVTRLYELAIFAWDYGVVVRLLSLLANLQCIHQLTVNCQTRAAKGFLVLSLVFLTIFIPIERLATREANVHPRSPGFGISAREQLRRRGSF